MPDPTTNFGWDVPTTGGDNNAWGPILLALFDEIDADLHAVKLTADAAAASLVDVLTLAANAQAQQTLYIPAEAFVVQESEDTFTYGATGQYLTLDDAPGSRGYAPLTLPVGATLNEVHLYCDKQGLTSLTVNVLAVLVADGTVSTIGTGARSAAGYGAASATAIAHVIGAEFLKLQVVPAGSVLALFPRIYGAKVLYTPAAV